MYNEADTRANLIDLRLDTAGWGRDQISRLIPSLEEKLHIVAYLDEVQAHAAELQHAAEAIAADLNRLEQSILAQAFKGKL